MSEENPFKRNDHVSSADEEEPIDADSCNQIELTKAFEIKYKIVDEKAVSLQKDYILKLCSDSAFTRVAVGLSNSVVKIFDIDQCRTVTNAKSGIPPCDNIDLCGITFVEKNSNALLIGTTDGIVRLFDLRTGEDEASFKNLEAYENCPRGISCFDVNANGRIICAGTDKFANNVSLNFFDVRTQKHMGAYIDSHADDVTCVRFHPNNPDLLCTGSVDGLINVFDIKEPDEYDALITTLNTESSVQKLDWHLSHKKKDKISCITHTNDFKAYEEDDLIADFSRTKITDAAKRINVANCNLVSAHSLQNGEIFLVMGTNFEKGKVLRTLYWQKENLKPMADLDGNKQIVRDSLFEPKNNVLITAGESGIVSLWNACTADDIKLSTDSDRLKSKSKKLTRREPY